jgi:hypothetical protein
MAGSKNSQGKGKRYSTLIFLFSWLCLLILSLSSWAKPSIKPEKLTGVYIPSICLNGRSFEGIVHYMDAAGLNMAVLHAKDPMGRLFWESKNRIATHMEASAFNASLEKAVNILKQKGIWTVAKLDVFQDSLLVTYFPEMGVLDSKTGELWADRKGLHWANPYDQRVWKYTIELCLELIDIGIDEIQFDYIRFPSDGDLSVIKYPIILEGTSKADCIGEFLAYAQTQLKAHGVTLSVDIFGLTAWKSEDFGVGQVLEKIAPHVDVLCPMLYPSHFPENFLSLKNPGSYPYKILKLSLEEMKKRTDTEIRPWIQGFWYTPEEINVQLQGVVDNGLHDWTVWNPTGKYDKTFSALEAGMGVQFPVPEFYPSLEELRGSDDLVIQGRAKIINHTNYIDGYSIISLDESVDGEPNEYATIIAVLSTLDESIVDRILTSRGLSISHWTNRYTKAQHITNLIIQDLDTNPRRMRPSPIYIDWDGNSVFTKSIPAERLELYRSHTKHLKSVIAGLQQ